jgi:hypothetical protein
MAGEIQVNSVTALTESGSNIVLNNVDTATNRTNLGLGSIATQNANAVTLTGGSLTGVQGAVSAWARITATASGSETIANGFGISSIARQGTGKYRIGFSTPSPVNNTNYMIFGTVTIPSTSTYAFLIQLVSGDTKTTSEFDFYVSYAGSPVSTGARDYSNWSEIYLQVIGV